MGNLVRLIVLVFIIEFVESHPADCPIKYGSECKHVILEMDKKPDNNPLPGTLVSQSPYLEVYYVPFEFVNVRCHNSPDWSKFDIDIRSLVQDAEELVFSNCSFPSNDINIMSTAKCLGAKNALDLTFKDTHGKFVISNSNLKGYVQEQTKLKAMRFLRLAMKRFPRKLFRGLTNLEEIQFKLYDFIHIPGTLFKGLTNLQKIDLYYPGNSLRNSSFPKKLPETLFHGLFNLTSIAIRSGISRLHEHSFRHLSNLKKIILHTAYLEDLPETLLQGLIKLKYFTILFSEIQEIPENFFQKLPNLKTVSITSSQSLNIPRKLIDDLSGLEDYVIGGKKKSWFLNLLKQNKEIPYTAYG